MAACPSLVPDCSDCRLWSAEILGHSGQVQRFEANAELSKHPWKLWLTHTKNRQTNIQTYQELLSVHKHMILGNVYAVPGQSQDQLIEGRRVCA